MAPRDRQRRLIRSWRGSPLAPVLVLALLAVTGSGACAATSGPTRPGASPQPARFRAQLQRYLAEGRYSDVERLLAETRADELALAASDRADIRYMTLQLPDDPAPRPPPGIDPFPRPTRIWTLHVPDDPAATNLHPRLARFAAGYNRALAQAERGVR